MSEYLTDFRAGRANRAGRVAHAEHLANFETTLQVTAAAFPSEDDDDDGEVMHIRVARTPFSDRLYLVDICMLCVSLSLSLCAESVDRLARERYTKK